MPQPGFKSITVKEATKVLADELAEKQDKTTAALVTNLILSEDARLKEDADVTTQ